MRRLIYVATVAGLTGLVVFHADAFGTILNAASSTFRKAVNLA